LHKKSGRRVPECVSVGFIAKSCGVSNATVLRWIYAGKLPAFRLPGGYFRIELKKLSEFLAEYNMPSAIGIPGFITKTAVTAKRPGM